MSIFVIRQGKCQGPRGKHGSACADVGILAQFDRNGPLLKPVMECMMRPYTVLEEWVDDRCAMWGSKYRCDRCGVLACVQIRLLYYHLETGETIVGVNQPAWCLDCKAVRSAERLPNAAAIAATVHDLEVRGVDDETKQDATLLGQDADSLFSEKLQRARAALRWRIARRSPPRCLECGSNVRRAFTSQP